MTTEEKPEGEPKENAWGGGPLEELLGSSLLPSSPPSDLLSRTIYKDLPRGHSEPGHKLTVSRDKGVT